MIKNSKKNKIKHLYSPFRISLGIEMVIIDLSFFFFFFFTFFIIYLTVKFFLTDFEFCFFSYEK